MPHTQSNTSLSPFHKQLLCCWEEVHAVQPNTTEEIYNKYIFDNKYICSGRKPLEYKILKLSEELSKDLVIGDIVSEQGLILSKQEIETKFHVSIDILTYNIIASAIPQAWKDKIRTNAFHIQPIWSKVPRLILNNKSKEITAIENKALYWAVIGKKYKNHQHSINGLICTLSWNWHLGIKYLDLFIKLFLNRICSHFNIKLSTGF